MNTAEYADYLQDIREAVADIQSFTANMDFEGFKQDKKTLYSPTGMLSRRGRASD